MSQPPSSVIEPVESAEPGSTVESTNEQDQDSAIPTSVREAVNEMTETLAQLLPGTPTGTPPRVSIVPPTQQVPTFARFSPPNWSGRESTAMDNLLKNELQIPLPVRTAFHATGYSDIRSLVEMSIHDPIALTHLHARADFNAPEFGDVLLLIHCLGKCFANARAVPGLNNPDAPPDPSRFPEDASGTDEFLRLLRMEPFHRTYRRAYRVFRGPLSDACDARVRDDLVGSVVSTSASGSVGNSTWTSMSSSGTSRRSKQSRHSRTSRHSSRSRHSQRPKNHNRRYQPGGTDYAFTGTPATTTPTAATANANNSLSSPSTHASYDTQQRASQQFLHNLDPRLKKPEKDEKRQTLPARHEWKGAIEDFEAFQNKVEGHYGQCGAGYLFDPAFQAAYVRDGPACYVEFLDDIGSASQIKKDVRALYGALKSACHVGVGRTILLKHNKEQDGVRTWMELVSKYEADGDPEVRISKLENVISVPFHRHYTGGLTKWVQDYENSFAELETLGELAWTNDASKKRRILQNAQNIGMSNTLVKQITADRSFAKVCELLRSHALQNQHVFQERAARKAKAANTVMTEANQDSDYDVLVERILTSVKQAQVAPSSELTTLEPTEDTSAMTIVDKQVCRVLNVPAEAWNLLSFDVKDVLRAERRRLEDGQRSSNGSGGRNTGYQSHKPRGNGMTTHPNQATGTTRAPTTNSGTAIPNQYSAKHVATEHDSDPHAALIEAFLAQEDLDDSGDDSNEYSQSHVHMARTLSTSNTSQTIANVFNSLYLPATHHVGIMDSGADTTVLGKGWLILSEDATRRANVIGFDRESAVKGNLPIVTAITAMDLPDGKTILLRVNEAVHNPTSEYTLFSEYQLRDFGVELNTIPKKHGGLQTMVVNGLKLELGLRDCMTYLEHREPRETELDTKQVYDVTRGGTPWNPQCTTNTDNCATTVDEPDDVDENLVQHARTDVGMDIQVDVMTCVRYLETVTQDPNYQDDVRGMPPLLHRALPAKLDYRKLSKYFLYRPKDVIQHTLNQTTQLAKAIIHTPLRRHLKSRFLMLRKKRLNEVVATDTYFSSEVSLEGYTCSQVFFGCTSRTIDVYGLRTESQFADAYQDFMRDRGIPHTLRRDNAKSEKSERVKELHRDLIIADQWTEPHSPWQNPAENNGVKFLKAHSQTLMNRTNAPANTWFLCHQYTAAVYNECAHPNNNWRIPNQVSGGETRDISHLLQFYWFEPVLYLDPVAKFPQSKEKPGYFVGFGENVGDALTFKILKEDMRTVLHRSVVRSATDPRNRNRQVNFQTEVDEGLNRIDLGPPTRSPASTTRELDNRNGSLVEGLEMASVNHVRNKSTSNGNTG